MILVDTSVWIDHLRAADPKLIALLEDGQALIHAFVIGEIALGRLRDRDTVIGALRALPFCDAVPEADVLAFIRDEELMGTGIGYVDAHILAAAARRPNTYLWTRDKALHAVAQRLGLMARSQM